jgi:hypothetical protein
MEWSMLYRISGQKEIVHPEEESRKRQLYGALCTLIEVLERTYGSRVRIYCFSAHPHDVTVRELVSQVDRMQHLNAMVEPVSGDSPINAANIRIRTRRGNHIVNVRALSIEPDAADMMNAELLSWSNEALKDL